MDRDRYNGAASDLNGARVENSGTDLGIAVTSVTVQDGVVRDDAGSAQIELL